MKKRAFRTELLAELRELVATQRRIAAVAEHDRAMQEPANEKPTVEPNGFIHTRGPKEGQAITDDEQGR